MISTSLNPTRVNTLLSITLAAVLTLLIGQSAHAASVGVSASDPTVDGADIKLFDTDTTPDNTNGDDNAIWFDRPFQGQTFTTGANAAGYTMAGFSFQGDWADAFNIGDIELGVGTLSGTTFSSLTTESIADASTPSTLAGKSWINVSLGAPLSLSANTTYAFFLGVTNNGFGDVLTRSTVGTDYSGGSAFRDADLVDNSSFENPVALQSYDRIFHVDLVANTVPAPAALPAGLALIGLAAMRRRRMKHPV